MLHKLIVFLKNLFFREDASNDVKCIFQYIESNGGSDSICEEVLSKIYSSVQLRSIIEETGVRESTLPHDRLTIGFAAINSLMLARKGLLDDPSSVDMMRRLENARRALRYSFFIFSDAEFAKQLEDVSQGFLLVLSGKERPRTLYEDRVEQAEVALTRWMEADIDKHTFI